MHFKQLKEPAIPVTKRLKNYSRNLDQINQERLRVRAAKIADSEPNFLKQLYRLKGFAYLRSNQVEEVES